MLKKVWELSDLPTERGKYSAGGDSNNEVGLDGSSAISRPDFVAAINEVLVPANAERVVFAVREDAGTYYFPCFIDGGGGVGGILRPRELRLIADLYPGRSEVATQAAGPSACKAFLDTVFDQQKRWQRFSLRVLAGGPMERLLQETARDRKCAIFLDGAEEFPYITLPATWDEYYAGLAKKFRYNIRNSEKLLNEAGRLSLRKVIQEKDVQQFLVNAYSVERRSWKEGAGTSITQNSFQEEFHTRLAPIAAQNGWFRGYLLFLDELPVAHVYGVLCNGVFYSLKISYAEDVRKYSPGNVVAALAIQDLIENGVKFWDWSGPMEHYKKRWSKEAYGLHTYSVYSRSALGRLSTMRRRAGRVLARE